MKTTLKEDMLWRGVEYPAGEREIPDELAIALGLVVIDPTETAQPILNPPPIPALDLINEAETLDALTVLPTIGKGAAKLIFDRRPEGGYSSFDALVEATPELLKSPYTTDWETVKGWYPA